MSEDAAEFNGAESQNVDRRNLKLCWRRSGGKGRQGQKLIIKWVLVQTRSSTEIVWEIQFFISTDGYARTHVPRNNLGLDCPT